MTFVPLKRCNHNQSLYRERLFWTIIQAGLLFTTYSNAGHLRKTAYGHFPDYASRIFISELSLTFRNIVIKHVEMNINVCFNVWSHLMSKFRKSNMNLEVLTEMI